MLTTPLLPDDYLALINPAWSTRELTGTLVRIQPETSDCSTIVIKPDFPWPGHRSGQYLRIGVEINGIRHWRAYTLTSDPNHPEGLISVTVKYTEGGRMSPYFLRQAQLGQTVFLGEVEGTFEVETAPKLLMLSAGSGITPIVSILRELDRRHALDDVIHVHSARGEDDVIFAAMLADLAKRRPGYVLKLIDTRSDKRLGPENLAEHVPDWQERETLLSGPRAMIDSIEALYDEAQRSEHLHTERFQPVIGTGGGTATGGTVRFRVTDKSADCGPGISVLVGGEQAGAVLPFGCRMGICHTCVGRLREGQVRDLRTDEITSANGQMIRVCVNAPEGHIEIDL